MEVIIYHNPRCSKSRQTLELITENNITPVIIDYQKNPPTHQQLDSILRGLDKEPRQLMRTKETEYAELNLDNSALSRDQLIEAMIATPNVYQSKLGSVKKMARLIARGIESVNDCHAVVRTVADVSTSPNDKQEIDTDDLLVLALAICLRQ